ncbi:MAG TPA: DUF6062 family protein [Ignavibacteriales bacterium]|nr:DUF6062 family protein [Ignavibacteriales bacterium]
MYNDLRKEITDKMEQEQICSLCSLLTEYEFDFLSRLQYEIANNREIRSEIASEGGFCGFHYRQFKKIASGRTNALLLKTIMEESAFDSEEFKINCRICQANDKLEDELVGKELELLQDNAFMERFSLSTGLCFEHLHEILRRQTDSEKKKWLIKTNQMQINRIFPDIESILNAKSFYEVPREKRHLISVMVLKLSGRRTLGL